MGGGKFVQIECFGDTFCALSKFVVCFIFDVIEREGGFKLVRTEKGGRGTIRARSFVLSASAGGGFWRTELKMGKYFSRRSESWFKGASIPADVFVRMACSSILCEVVIHKQICL